MRLRETDESLEELLNVSSSELKDTRFGLNHFSVAFSLNVL
jgi:hypothetical protein